MIKIGIMELIIWTVFPVAIRRPIVKMTETLATIKGDIMRTIFLKKNNMRRKIIIMAKGAEMAICLNISTPKVSSATGRPVIKYCSSPENLDIFSFNLIDTL